MKLLVVLCLCLVELCVGGPPGLNFNACDAQLPDLDDCLRTSIQSFFEELGKPIPDGNKPALREPLKAESLILGPGEKFFGARLALRDIETYGWAQTKFERATVSVRRQNITLRGISPALTIKSQYRAEGKVLDKPLIGEGALTTILENVLWQWDGYLEVIERDGERYWRRYASTVSLEPERLRLELENQEASLIQGLNENWRDLYGELQSDYENIINAVLARLADQVYSQAPIKTFVINY